MIGNHDDTYSQASSHVLTFFLRISLRCSTCSPQQCSSLEARHFAFFMMIQIGSITDFILSMNSFSSQPQISLFPSRHSNILVHLKVIQADTTSVFSCTTLLSNVSSWISDQHCINRFLFLSASFIRTVKYSSSSAIRSPFFSLCLRSFRLGHSVFLAACPSSHNLLHSQQNQHWHMHFMCEHPTFFSIGCLHFGHSLVLFFIQEELAYSEFMSVYHRFTLSQATGQCGSLRHLQQYNSPHGQVTVFIYIMFGFMQKYGHFSLGQQQMSLFWMAQLMQIFFLFNSTSSEAMESTKPLRTGAFQQCGSCMQDEKMRPLYNYCLMQLVQQLLQQRWGQNPEENSKVCSKQTSHCPALPFSAVLLRQYSFWQSVSAFQSSTKQRLAIFSQFH